MHLKQKYNKDTFLGFGRIHCCSGLLFLYIQKKLQQGEPTRPTFIRIKTEIQLFLLFFFFLLGFSNFQQFLSIIEFSLSHCNIPPVPNLSYLSMCTSEIGALF